MPNSDKTVVFELTTTHKQYGLVGDDKTLLREDVTKRYFRKSANAYRAQKRANGVNFEVFMISDYAGPLEDAV